MIFTELETKRLLLKNISAEDTELVYCLFSDEFINRYLYDAEPLTDISEAKEIIGFYIMTEPRNQHRWVINLKDTKEKIGTCGFHCWDRETGYVEIGYDLMHKHNGYGYMQEALEQLLIFAKDVLEVKCISATIYVGNEKSKNLVFRSNFVKTGEKVLNFRNHNYQHDIYSLFFSEGKLT